MHIFPLTRPLDWEEYNLLWIHTKLEGCGYRYAIDNVLKMDLDKLWKLLEEHYNRPLDSKWGMYAFYVFPPSPLSYLQLYTVSRWVNSEIDDEGSQQVEGEESDKGKGKRSDGSREDEDNKQDEDDKE